MADYKKPESKFVNIGATENGFKLSIFDYDPYSQVNKFNEGRCIEQQEYVFNNIEDMFAFIDENVYFPTNEENEDG